MTEPVRWKQEKEVAARRIDDQVVLVNLRTNHIYSLNATGSRAWELLNVARSRDELVSALREEFEVDQGTLERETDELLASLEEAKLVTAGGD
jgi:hypothetical protein